MYEYVFFGSKRTIASWCMKFFQTKPFAAKIICRNLNVAPKMNLNSI